MNRVKVLFVVESLSSGGAEKQLFLLLSNINLSKFEPFLITWSEYNFYDENLLPGVKWINLPRSGKLDLKMILKGIALVKKEKIQIVQGFLDSGNLYATLVSIFTNVILICSERSSFRKLSWIRNLHKLISHKLANLTITNSVAGFDYLLSLGVSKNKIKLIRNGFELEKYNNLTNGINKNTFRSTLDLPKDKFIILNIGRFVRSKNQKLILDAASNLRNKNDILFLFIGDISNEYFREFTNLVENSNLREQIMVIKQNKKISEYYIASDLMVFPSLLEGSPNVPIEALAHGMKIISTQVGDLNYYLPHFEFSLISGTDSIELTNLLENEIKLFQSTIFYNNAKENINKLYELNSDVTDMVKNYEYVYTKILIK